MRYFLLKPVVIADGWMKAAGCSVPPEEALGMVAAEDVVCACDVPSCTCALRDGWAVSTSENGRLRRPASWRVENGSGKGELLPNEAVWVNTGGAIPRGADAVIACREIENEDGMNERPKPGENIARQGSDWRCGEVILPKGSRVGAREMALLYEAGVQRVVGRASPRVAVVATGNELAEKAEGLASGLRRSSNASYIKALMLRIGVKDVRTVLVPDDRDSLAETLRELDLKSDAIITVGGTGRGFRDYTRQAVKAAGGRFVGSDSQTDSPFIASRRTHRPARQSSRSHNDRAVHSSRDDSKDFPASRGAGAGN